MAKDRVFVVIKITSAIKAITAREPGTEVYISTVWLLMRKSPGVMWRQCIIFLCILAQATYWGRYQAHQREWMKLYWHLHQGSAIVVAGLWCHI